MSELIGHPELRDLYLYWLGKRRARALPARADVNPLELPGALWQHLMLMDVVREAGALRFRYRLVGGVVERELGRSVTGAFADEVTAGWGDYGRYLAEIYGEAAAGQPIYTETIFLPMGWRLATLTRRLVLPLASDGTTVDMVLSGHVFDRQPGAQLTAAADIRRFRELVRHRL